MKSRILGLLLSATIACTGSLRTQVVQVSNGVADVANAGGQAVLSRYCVEQMRAIGRTGLWDGRHCNASGPRAGTEATAEERAQLEQVRTRWQQVIGAADRVASAHDAVVHLIEANDEAARRNVFPALARLAEAYQDLAEAARLVGINLPPIVAGEE